MRIELIASHISHHCARYCTAQNKTRAIEDKNRPSLSIEPQLGVGEGILKPGNYCVTSSRITTAMRSLPAQASAEPVGKNVAKKESAARSRIALTYARPFVLLNPVHLLICACLAHLWDCLSIH